jgi:hypothetical protein
MIIQSESELILQGYEIYVTAIDFNLLNINKLKLDPQISKGFVTTGRYGWQRRPQ